MLIGQNKEKINLDLHKRMKPNTYHREKSNRKRIKISFHV